jgi:hypothetical protein
MDGGTPEAASRIGRYSQNWKSETGLFGMAAQMTTQMATQIADKFPKGADWTF